MNKTIKTIATITILGIMMILSYWLGTTQTETITIEKEVEKVVEVVPNGYIDMYSSEFKENYVDMREVVYFEVLDKGLQLYFVDGSGYWMEY